METTTESKPRRKWLRRLGFGCLGLVLLIVVFVAYLVIAKPWTRDVAIEAPMTGGTRVTDGGMIANYYAPPSNAKPGAVLVIGGSEGGLSDMANAMGASLREAGYRALVLSYWGGPEQERELNGVPLERVAAGLDWLKKQPGVEGKLALIGYSKGAEAALLLGARRNDLTALVAQVPSHLAWQGISPLAMMVSSQSSFTWQGETIPHMPYRNVDFMSGPTPYEIHSKSLVDQAQFPEAQIEVEKIGAALLLTCAGRDKVWPSCPMAEKIVARRMSKGTSAPILLAYPEAGHALFAAPATKDRPDPRMIGRMGGDPAATTMARADAWTKTIAFLDQAMGATTTGR